MPKKLSAAKKKRGIIVGTFVILAIGQSNSTTYQLSLKATPADGSNPFALTGVPLWAYNVAVIAFNANVPIQISTDANQTVQLIFATRGQ